MTDSYQVAAHNTAKASENKIHDDAVARRFGFSGGLVPGVDVYAYMVHPAVARWGRAWLERGRAEIRLLKPVYDGAIATVTAAAAAGDALELRIDSGAELCATGHADLPPEAATLPDAFATAPVPAAPPDDRPPASDASLAPGTWLAARPLALTREAIAEHLDAVREREPLYQRDGLAHPGLILRTANWVMNHNVVFGPWMHVGSTVTHFGLARIGDELSARGHVTANYERKGHHFVECDVLVYVNGATPVARIALIAIWRPRQLAAA